MKKLDSDIFKNDQDYWMIADNIKSIYMSDGSMQVLLDFERVLNELDIFAFRNWELGELVAGPEQGPYKTSCTFLWPQKLMPDPRGAMRLLPFDCEVKWKKTKMKVPVRVKNPSDFKAGTKVAKLTEKDIWLVEIIMPKSLMSDIRTGSIELEDETVDLQDLDDAYSADLDQQAVMNTDAQAEMDTNIDVQV
jgi:hypothetical protein